MDNGGRSQQEPAIVSKKLKTKTEDGNTLPKGKTMVGSKPDQITVNPVMEDKNSTAVMAFGRFNPPTVGHEKLIHHVENVAKEHGGTAHIIASHSQGTGRDPLPQDKKLDYLKKVVSKGTEVHGSSKEKPSFLHHAAALSAAGHQHLVMVAGSDRVDEYHKLLHKYNGKEGHHNFKSIKVVSAGHRDPDAEGAEGMSGTKLRSLARSGDHAGFKSGLPKSLHPHAKEIGDHIRAVKEDLETDTLFDLYDIALEEAEREVLTRQKTNTNKKFEIFAKKNSRKDNDATYKHQEIQKKIIDEDINEDFKKFKKDYVRVLPGQFARSTARTKGVHDPKTNQWSKGKKIVGIIKGKGLKPKYYLHKHIATRHKALRLEDTSGNHSE